VAIAPRSPAHDEGVTANPGSSPEPQAILTPLTEAALFLTATVEAGAEDAVRDVLADVSGLRRSVGFRIPEGELSCVVGIGSDVWERLFGAPRPAELHPFREVAGPRHTAPATPGDLLFHIRAHRLDLCFELARQLTIRLDRSVRVVDEVHGFRSFDERDLLGFVDGTENPEGAAAATAVLIGDEDPAFAGGSYVVIQKYLHDLAGWDALPVEAQERAIGRTKLSDIELPDELKPSDSHVALNTIVDESGEERQIVRLNMPFGKVGAREFGTYFIGYSRTPEVTEQMLINMFVGKPPGNSDRILDFSTAVTGNLFFVPTVDFLDDPPVPGAGTAADPVAARADPEPPDDAASGGDSLAIGSLREVSS
jgi:putative iron-dependent peroxidase